MKYLSDAKEIFNIFAYFSKI